MRPLKTRYQRAFRVLGIFSAGGILATATVAASGFLEPALADNGTVVLTNNVLQGLSSLTPLGDTNPTNAIGIGLGLQGADPAAVDAYIAGAYDPASPLYGQFLDPADYEAQFGVPTDRFNSAVSWLGASGLQVQTIPGSSEYVLASGTVSQVESLLGIQIKDFTSNGRAFYANVTAPTVPSALQVIGITGLNNVEGPHLSPQVQSVPPAVVSRPATLSPSANMGLTTPSDLWSIYNQPANNKGEGQKMAIFGWGTTNNTAADLQAFEHEYGLPAVPLTISYYGTETAITDSGGEGEWNIDTQASTGMAPNVVGEHLYFGKAGTDADLVAAYHAWAADRTGPLQGSSSFGGCEQAPGTNGLSGSPGSPTGVLIAGNPNQDLYERVLKRIVAEGRTMFASTGDTGSGCPVVSLVVNGVTLIPTPMMNYPSVSAYATAVGGTVLYFNNATPTTPASRALEFSWTHTGGGTSDFIKAGTYQQTANPPLLFRCVSDPHGNPYPLPPPLCRGVPDVAAQSGDVPSNGYTVTMSQANDSQGGGTSLSSPLWLGMWTRIQAASSRSKGNGFAAATIYRVAGDPTKYARDFFDIGGATTDTVVTCNGPNPAFNCSHPGWDYTSGWGVPNITNLMLDADGKTAPTHLTTPNPAPPQPTFPGTNGGTTCPGPQVVDPVGDAGNNVPGGDGKNVDSLDVVNASFASPNATTLQVTLAVHNLSAPPPPANFASGIWAVYWTYNGTEYFAKAESTGSGPAATWAFTDGIYSGNRFTSAKTITGTANPGLYSGGTAGTLVMNVPLADVGNPPAGASLTNTFADTRASLIAVYWTAPVDRGPNRGFGAPWTVGQVC